MNRFLLFFIPFFLLHLSNPTPISAQGGAEATSTGLEPAIHFTHLTSDDGLAQNSVEAILQDRQGFMWIGTPAGLSRFDGYRFTTYKHDPANPNSLSHNHIRDLFEDQEGLIWIATEGGGVNKFDPRTETFTRYLPDPKNPNSLAGDRVFTIFQDSAGNFWFVGGGLTGLNKFNPATQTYTRYVSDPNNPATFQGGGVWDMLEDEAGNLWLAATNLLAKYNPTTEDFTYYQPSTPEEARLAVLHRDAAGNLWAAGTAGLYQFDPQRETFTHYPAPRGVDDLLEDEAGNFWLAARSGLYVFDPRTGQMLHHYYHEATQVDSLSDDSLTELYRDRAGVLWIGTGEAGLNLYDPLQARFAHYRHNPNTSASLAANTVDALYVAAEGRLWLGVGNALDLIDFANGQVRHYPLTAEGMINAIYQDRAGLVWLGLSGFRLYRFDPATGQFTPYPFKTAVNRPTPPKSIVDFYEDKAGALWIAVDHDGLYQLDPSRQKVQFYEGPPSLSALTAGAPYATAPRPPITDLYGDRTGQIWISTLNGFSRFDPGSGTYRHYRARAGDAGPDSYMEAVLEDRNDLIWVASRDGLIRFDPNTETAKYYTETEGLPTAYIVGLLQDQSGNLWLSTKKGLVKFDPQTETFRHYDAADGLQGNEFTARAFGRAADGRMFFGGTNGLTAFYPEQINDNPYQPPVVLTGFQLFNKPVLPGRGPLLPQALWQTDKLTLQPDMNVITFEFAALSYAAPAKNRYRYRLEGFESAWNEVGSDRRFATYTNLPPGEYVFRVQGSNNNGVWSDQEARLNVVMLPPWWDTLWSRAAALLGLVGLVYGGYRWRVQSIERRNRLLESQVAVRTRELTERTEDLAQSYALLEQEVIERQRAQEQLLQAKALAEERSQAAEAANRAKSAFLANMSHELRSPLNIILGFAQVMVRSQTLSSEQRENLRIISRSGEHLLSLINQVLDFSKIEAGRISLNENDFDLYHLLTDLEDMFSLKASDKGLRLIFDQPADLPRYIRTDEVKLRQVLINLLSNALKFIERGEVTLTARMKDEGGRMKEEDINNLHPSSFILQISISDTGPGIAPDEMDHLFEAFVQTETGRQMGEGTGLGLPISRKFVQLMGGDITVESEVGHGTTFKVEVKVQLVDKSEIVNRKSTIENRVVALEPGQPQYRILVVDDQWANRQLLVKLLSPLGFDLREAENGQQALEIWQEFAPQLIWMDMRMPVMDGYQAAQRIKATTQGQATAIIALTASAFEEERAVVLSAGCDDFLRKPFREADIFALMRKHIGVRFVYAADSQPAAAPESREKFLLEDLASGRADLPAELLAQLIEGAELGDIELIDQTIAEIRPLHSALADELARLAHHFEYDKIIKLIRGGAA
ncbi:MAG: hypothetical protein DPW09_28045 [Anaerolineae bacterium]|nr:response regulator [Anaerolineales bacterium]MCQ3977300.1 hypothetical protein [Anaerolineae bacterium]